MKSSQTNFLSICLFCLALILGSCSDKVADNSMGTTILDTMSNDKIKNTTRRSEAQASDVTFTVIYDGELQTLLKEPDSDLKSLMQTYHLLVKDSFEIDEFNKGIILAPSQELETPIELGRELSLVKEVLMVEISNTRPTIDSVS